jgi:YjbE family integral membrane protein
MNLDVSFWSTLIAIIGINLLLSGDNAVVIALATLRLGPKEKKQGIFWGTFGAVFLRVLLTAVAAFILKFPFVQAIGGALLTIIAVKLLKGEDEDENIQAASNLRDAIQTIIFADLIMSLDNVLAVAGASGGNTVLLVFGLLLSIPIVIFGSNILSTLMKRFPWIVSLGAGLLGYTAGEMILKDAFFHFMSRYSLLEYLIPGSLAIGVILLGHWLKRNQSANDNEPIRKPV